MSMIMRSSTEPRLRSVGCISPAGLHRMAYQEWGDQDNPNVVICVHGLTRVSSDFSLLAQSIRGDYRVVCPDVVGRGQSSWLNNPQFYGIAQYVSDMVTLIARTGVTQVRWVGTSMGGLIGMTLAALPNTPVSHLVLNDVGAVLSGQALARIGTYVGLNTEFKSRAQAHVYLRTIFSGFGEHTEAEWAQLLDAVIVDQPEKDCWRVHYDPAIAAAFRATAVDPQPPERAPPDLDLWSVYDAIECPTLVLRGENSDLLSAQTVRDMAQRGPKAAFVEFAGVGHAPTLMHADQIGVVQRFFTALAPARPVN
jgi:pimeloyl-ACP methyl ester carboxylesterase